MLRESRRALKPGGIVRICVPDLAHAVALYASSDKRAMLENYFFVEDRASFLARHKYMYRLRAAGSRAHSGLRRCATLRVPRRPDADLVHLDNRPEETLYVEAATAAVARLNSSLKAG